MYKRVIYESKAFYKWFQGTLGKETLAQSLSSLALMVGNLMSCLGSQ